MTDGKMKAKCHACNKVVFVPIGTVRLTRKTLGFACPICTRVQWHEVPDNFRATVLLSGAMPPVSEISVLAFIAASMATDLLAEVAMQEVAA